MKHKWFYRGRPGLYAITITAVGLMCSVVIVNTDIHRDALDRSLLEAISHHDDEGVDRLLAAGANANAVATDEPALTWFSLPEFIWRRLRSHSVDPMHRRRKSALALVYQFDMIDQLEQPSCDSMAVALLRHGANTDIIDDRENKGPLSKAALRGLHKTLRFLLTHGYNANQRDSKGFPPLDAADLYNTRLLLEFGADPNALSPDGGSPLMAVSFRRSADIVRALLHAGADARAVDHTGHGTLYYMLADLQPGLDRDNVVNILAEHGARLTSKDHLDMVPALTPAERKRYRRLGASGLQR